MLSFVNDYSEGADERILQRLLETNREQLPGYGEDRYCLSAREKIRSACGCPDADIYFLTGGTQTNKIVISSLLAPWQGVVAAESGHIGTHEAGAIENAGHKVLTLPHREGKLMPDTLAQYLRSFYADVLKEGFRRKGYHFYLDSPTNQIFVILENSRMEALSRQAAFCFWEKLDASHTVVRFATSWATSMQDVEALVQLL